MVNLTKTYDVIGGGNAALCAAISGRRFGASILVVEVAPPLVLRQTSAMNALLALHLGVVFALFVTPTYGKFAHGIYRFAALTRYAQERRAQAH